MVVMAKRLQLQSCREAMLMVGRNQSCFYRSVQTVAADASRRRAIPVCVAPTVDEFMHGCYKAQTPMVIQGAMETWASRKWTPESLKERFGHLSVPVELGFWNEDERRYGDYRDLYQESGIAYAGSKEYFMPHQPMSLSEFIDIFMCKREGSSSPPELIGYMAQHQLLTEVPEMANDIPDPDYVKAQREVYQRNIWLGPAGTVSPLHFDPYHNILAQIWGTKHIRLYAPEESSRLYPFTSSMLLRNSSQVNPEDSHAINKWPEFNKALHWDCELRAGEMLYIPLKWWHYVRAASNSLSASFWWLS